MAVYKVPSIWDMIAGAGSQGIESFQDAKEKLRRDQMANASMLTQLYGAGAIDNTDLMPGLKPLGITANIKPSTQQRARTIIGSPELNPATGKPWTTEERKLAGLPSRAEAAEEEAKYSYLQGGAITPRQAAALKLPDDEEIAQGKELTKDKILASIGPRYVDQALAQVGTINHKNLNTVVDSAFQRYASDRRAAGLPVDPAHRSFFASQAVDRLKDQEMLDIQRINANKVHTSSGLDATQYKMYMRYQADVKEANDAIETMERANPALSFMATKAMSDPSHQFAKNPQVQRYLEATNKLTTAQRNLDLVEYGPSGRQPIGGPGQAPRGAPAGGSSVIDGGGKNYEAFADRIVSGKATIAQLAGEVKAGRLSTVEYNAIRELAIQKARAQGRAVK